MHRGRGDRRSSGPEGQSATPRTCPRAQAREGPPLTHQRRHLQNCGFQGSEKVPQLVSLKKFKDEPVLASLTSSGSKTCTDLLGHMQARTHSRANSNRLLAPREARPGECGTLPGHGLPATLWPQRGPLVSRAPEGELAVGSSCRRGRVGTACVQSSQDTHFAGGRGVSSASGPGPGALRSPPLRLPSCGRGDRGPRSPVLVAEVTCKPRQAGGPPACPRRKRV